MGLIQHNISSTERVLRIIGALTILVLYWQGVLSGTTSMILLIMAILLVVTSAANFCPAYRILGIDRWVKKS
ncbi:MAG: DUF2892 domain-containing protein [Candidatus Kapaibacterium sp.]|jgi:hypothetical protein